MTSVNNDKPSGFEEPREEFVQLKESKRDPIVIKKYANRRLYNTESSSYVTLEDLAAMVRSERDFVVFDAKSGEDLTRSVLTQIIVEEESKNGQNLLPINFLRQLIRFYGHSLERIVPSYLEFTMNTLTRDQDKYSQNFAGALGAAALEAMHEQAMTNIAMFEKAMTMFSPFPPIEARKKTFETASAGTARPGAEGADRPASADEIAELRSQIEAMQAQIDKLSRTSL